MHQSHSAGMPHPRAWLIFAVVAPALLMASIDGTIISVGLPVLTRELHTTNAWAAWGIGGSMLAQTITMPIAGKLSDEWGRKRLFLVSVAIYTAAAIGSVFAPTIYVLILFRVLQGVGGGGFLPSSTGIISETFGDRRMTAIGLSTSIFPLGGVIGPNLGGFLIDHISWRGIFFINVPVGILLLIAGTIVIPKSQTTLAERRPLDLRGGAYFAGGIFSILFGMTWLANHPHNPLSPMVWGFFVLGMVSLVSFLRHEARVPDPMVDLKLLSWRPFFAANVYNFIYGACVFGTFSFIPLYAKEAYNMSAGQTGLLLTPRSIVMTVVSILSSFFLIRLGYRLPMIIGAIFIAITFGVLSQGYSEVTLLGFHIGNLTFLAMMLMVAGFGIGIAGPASNNAALDLVPDKISAVSGIRGMFRSTGGVIGTAAIPLALSRFDDKSQGFEMVFFVLIFVVLLIVPLVFLIPDRARERHLAAKREALRPTAPEAASTIEM